MKNYRNKEIIEWVLNVLAMGTYFNSLDIKRVVNWSFL